MHGGPEVFEHTLSHNRDTMTHLSMLHRVLQSTPSQLSFIASAVPYSRQEWVPRRNICVVEDSSRAWTTIVILLEI